jgi:hypothetical protein
MLLLTISRPVSLAVRHPSGAHEQILLLSDSCGFVDMGAISSLQLLLGLVIAINPSGFMANILQSQI